MRGRLFVAGLTLAASALALAIAADPGPAALPPSRITLKQTDATLADAAAAFSKASGMTFAADPDVARLRAPVAFAGTPLWEALEKITRDTETKLVVADGGRRVTLARKGASK